MTTHSTAAKSRHSCGRSAGRLFCTAAVFLIAIGVLAGPTSASEPITSYSLGTSTTQAGAHPDITASFQLANPGSPEIAKNVSVNLPAGLFGNPGAIPKCESTNFALNECAPATQAGTVTVSANYEGSESFLLGTSPVYNLEPEGEDETARLGFVAVTVNVPIVIPVTVRAATDYGVRMNVAGIPQSIPLYSAAFEMWGFPADSSHDEHRFPIGSPGVVPGCPGSVTTGCIPTPYPKAAIFVRPYINNPSLCSGQPLTVSVAVETYADPSDASEATTEYPATTGCEKQRFDPILNAGLTTNETDAPSGLDLQLKADQFLEKSPSPSQLRSATVILPEGLSVNPDAADGQTSCTDAEAGFGSDLAGHCPDNSKIGTFDVRTPALEGPLVGSLYIGRPLPDNQYRVFMIADGFGVHAKFVASIQPDPNTGQLTMSVRDLPQVPFEEFNLHLFASDRGLVATPTQCTLYEVDSVFTPWNNLLAPQHSRPFLSLSSGPHGSSCPSEKRPFHPRLVAGATNAVAGAFSSFQLRLERDDGDQFLGDLNFRMPPGFTGSLRGISYCPDPAIQAAARNSGRGERSGPSCPFSSEVGTTNVAAGPGSHPFHAVGKMYLAGPFKGAPLSVVAVTPALAGPYDYGTVVVRVALHVDPLTAQVSAVSDTVPSIIGGIPIRMRSIQVNIDRPNFTINPTNCSPFTVDSQGIGDQGTVADFSSYFQVLNCRALSFKPKMTIRQLGGRKQTARSKNPAMRFDLWTRPGDANLKSIAVTLPKAFAIDQRHLGNICSRAQLAAERCAGRQAIGRVITRTPLLDKALTGPAYAVSGFGKLPHVVFILDGQVTIMPEAESSSVRGGHLKTVVPIVPDAPIGHFRLNLSGGDNGYLVNTRSLCASTAVVHVVYVAQSGRKRTQRISTKTACGKRPRAKRSVHRRAAR
jgi:hypothetical protein